MILINNFWTLFLLSAPWLMLGLLLAGLLNVFIPKDFLQRHLGQEGAWTTIKAALIGAPMPLCSCGVIPAAIGLRRAGASKSATTAFLVSTPETGVDSVSISYVLLGPFMAVIRPIAAVTSAVVAGMLVGREVESSSCQVEASTSSCCNTKPETKTSCCSSVKDVSSVSEKSGCCDGASLHHVAPPLTDKLWQAIKFSCNKLLSDTMLWLMIGLFFAAVVQTFVPASFLSQWGDGIIAMVVVILVSIPMYICATASTPIAAGLLMAGVSPGAVLVFMLAGPATNIATLGVVAKELGRRAVVAYLVGVIGVAIVFGFMTDYLVRAYDFKVSAAIAMEHEVLPPWLTVLCAILLSVLMIRLIVIDFGEKLSYSKG